MHHLERFLPLWLAAFVVAVAGQSIAVAAATGWYLLQPPLVEKGVTEQQMSMKFLHWSDFDKATQRDLIAAASLNFSVPLGGWVHRGSFDTADACERTRQKLIDFAKAREREIREKSPDGLPTLGTHLASESRCIASDDPRLAGR